MYRLLIVEDDRGIAEAIKAQAEMWGMQAHLITNFRNVMAEFADVEPHIVLLDIALPFFNGYHWCSEIRKVSKVPIIFISSASDNMNMIMAMNMGAAILSRNHLTRVCLWQSFRHCFEERMILHLPSRCWSTEVRFSIREIRVLCMKTRRYHFQRMNIVSFLS